MLRVVLVDFLHQSQLLLLQFLQLLLPLLFLLPHLNDRLRLLRINIRQLVLPILHITLLGGHRLLSHPSLALSLNGDEHMLHFLQFFIVLLRNILYFPRIVELDQVYGLLYILELFFVTRPKLLILSPEILDPLYFLRVVLLLLNKRAVTHCWILLTSTFFWMVYLVKCLCFFNASFSFCNCKRSN